MQCGSPLSDRMGGKLRMTPDERFQHAVSILLAHEGGLSENPSDPGGITNYGISLRAYPHLGVEGIRNLTRDQAAEIYRRDYWQALHIDLINDDTLATKVLDIAPNVGPQTGIILLQRALRAVGTPVAIDGIAGPQTISAVNASDPKALLAAFRSETAGHYRVLIAENPKLKVFENGWLQRAYS